MDRLEGQIELALGGRRKVLKRSGDDVQVTSLLQNVEILKQTDSVTHDMKNAVADSADPGGLWTEIVFGEIKLYRGMAYVKWPKRSIE